MIDKIITIFKLRFFVKICVLNYILATTNIAFASENKNTAIFSESLSFSLNIGGIHVANLWGKYDKKSNSYESSLLMKTLGIANWFAEFTAIVSGNGSISLNNEKSETIYPRYFELKWNTEKLAASQKIKYDPTNNIPISQQTYIDVSTGKPMPRDKLDWYKNRKLPGPVPIELRVGVFDPVSAFFEIRRLVKNNKSKNVRIPIFDGLRRFDIKISIEKPRLILKDGKEIKLVPATAQIDPIFGFNRRAIESIEYAKGTVYFTNDDRFIPLQLILEGRYLASVINLEKDCKISKQICEDIYTPKKADN